MGSQNIPSSQRRAMPPYGSDMNSAHWFQGRTAACKLDMSVVSLMSSVPRTCGTAVGGRVEAVGWCRDRWDRH